MRSSTVNTMIHVSSGRRIRYTCASRKFNTVSASTTSMPHRFGFSSTTNVAIHTTNCGLQPLLYRKSQMTLTAVKAMGVRGCVQS